MERMLRKIKKALLPGATRLPPQGFLQAVEANIEQKQNEIRIRPAKMESKWTVTNHEIFDCVMVELIFDLLCAEKVIFQSKNEMNKVFQEDEWIAQFAGQWKNQGVKVCDEKGDLYIVFPGIKKSFVATTWFSSSTMFEFWDACRYYVLNSEAAYEEPSVSIKDYKLYIYPTGDKSGVGVVFNPAYVQATELMRKIRASIEKYDLALEVTQ